MPVGGDARGLAGDERPSVGEGPPQLRLELALVVELPQGGDALELLSESSSPGHGPMMPGPDRGPSRTPLAFEGVRRGNAPALRT